MINPAHHAQPLQLTAHDCDSTKIHLRPWHAIVIRHLAGKLNAFCASEVKLKSNLRLHVRGRRTRGQSDRPRSLSSGYLFISHPVTFRASTSCNCTCRCLRSHRFLHDAKYKRNDGDRLVSNTNDSVINWRQKFKNKHFLSLAFVYYLFAFFSLERKRSRNPSLQVKNGTGATHWMISNRYQFY